MIKIMRNKNINYIVIILGIGILLNQIIATETNRNGYLNIVEEDIHKSNLINDFTESQPDFSATILENRTDYTKQMIMDPNFNEPISTSPWNTIKEEDLDDISSEINNQADYTIVGDRKTYFNISGIPDSTNWTSMSNPEFPVLPDSYGIDAEGATITHDWDESVNQTTNTPSVLWKRQICLKENMSDYTIISASINVTVNATVNSDVDTLTDNPTVGAVGDYVRFYARIENFNQDTIYEIAYNQTEFLGQDSPPILTMDDTLLLSIPEEVLLFYLTSVLESNDFNFTIAMGMNIYCEDNIPGVDRDRWTDLRIKSFNFSFSYEKNIDKLTSLTFNQTGKEINSEDYELGDANGDIVINEATLNFKYNISQTWPSSLINSEIKVFINNYEHTETIKLSNFSTIQQEVKKGSGFDITSLISVDQNVSIKLQLFLAEDFNLAENITLSIDDVYLNVSYTVIERRNPIATDLKTTDGLISKSITWNESFSFLLNYTNSSNGVGINNTEFTIIWEDSYDISEVGGGIYNISCNNSQSVSSLPYTLQIEANTTNTWYEQKSLSLEIDIIGRETYVDIFLGGTNMTTSPVITLPIMNQLNLTTHYYDKNYEATILDANVSIIGSGMNSSYYDYSESDDNYEFLINTTKLGLGTHLISLYAEKSNYSQSYRQIRIDVIPRSTHFNLFMNGINSTLDPEIEIPIMNELNITGTYHDSELSEFILNANANLSGTSAYTFSIIGNEYQFMVNTSELGIGTHYISLVFEKLNYDGISKLLKIKITVRNTFVGIFMNGINSTLDPEIEIPIMNELNITGTYHDSELSEFILNANANLSGTSAYTFSINGNEYQFMVNTSELGIGTHYISLVFEKPYYDGISKLLKIKITVRNIFVGIFMNGINSTLDPEIEIPIMNELNLTAFFYDTSTYNVLKDAVYSLDIDSSLYSSSIQDSSYQFLIDTEGLGLGNHYITLTLDKSNYDKVSPLLLIKIIPRETRLEIFSNETDSTDSEIINIPITGVLNLSVYIFDMELSELLQEPSISISGLDVSGYEKSLNNGYTMFLINSTDLGLGIHFISIIGSGDYYQEISKSYQINVNQIRTNITTTNFNKSYTVLPGTDFNLEISIENLDFGGEIAGCTVQYSWDGGEGTLIESSSGEYNIILEDVSLGIHTIYITVYKGPNYNFEQFEITLNVIAPQSENEIPKWAMYLMGTALVGLSASFVAYQQYFKFPKIIRGIKSLKKSIKKGKIKDLKVKTPQNLLVEEYINITKGDLSHRKQIALKNRYLSPGASKFLTKEDAKKKLNEKEKKKRKKPGKKVSSKRDKISKERNLKVQKMKSQKMKAQKEQIESDSQSSLAKSLDVEEKATKEPIRETSFDLDELKEKLKKTKSKSFKGVKQKKITKPKEIKFKNAPSVKEIKKVKDKKKKD